MGMAKGTKGKRLVIVESPAKARTIGRYLGKEYEVAASVGHVRDLPAKELGVDVEKGFEPKYVTIRGKGKILQDLKRKAKDGGGGRSGHRPGPGGGGHRLPCGRATGFREGPGPFPAG